MTDSPASSNDIARWEQRYVTRDLPWDVGRPDPHLANVIEAFDVPPGPAVEVGCGTGTNTIWLASRGFDVLGVDVSPTAIELAREKAERAGASCRLAVADFLSEPLPGGPFTFAYDRGCFHVFDLAGERSRFAAGVAAMLRVDGLWHSLIGSTDGPPREVGPPRRSAAEITAAIEPWFEILELRSTWFDSDVGDARAWVLVARRR